MLAQLVNFVYLAEAKGHEDEEYGSLLEETSSILENRERESESHDFEEVRSSI